MKWMDKLSASDKRALMLLAVFFVSLACYWGVGYSMEYQQKQKDYMAESRDLLRSIYLHGYHAKWQKIRSEKKYKSASQSLLSVASSTAKEKHIVFKRSQPEGDEELNVWIEQANFNLLLNWLALIQNQHGIQVAQISVEKTARAGFVDARISLLRP